MGPDEKFAVPTSFPAESAESTWTYFYRRATDAGKALPYFYDIELKPEGEYANKEGAPGRFAVGTWHGKPGSYMWRNHLWTFDSVEDARKQVKLLVSKRASFKGGPFLRSEAGSCRRGLPEEEADEAEEEEAEEEVEGGGEAPLKKQKTSL
ncbi:hypothetical protein TeGR_g1996 [Tetraparma gracilis]|uniref:Uncharacterized protein n=1 Tax=Tetraparma gracilis TaxID=2962635 RepID=A0ABQ6MMM9_9STRA|nr:hypothetical protein TeGR_g1996 [Tetraparma gracilis]